MSRYVALIRGINVGKASRVAMSDLRELFSDLGYTDVRTLLNSGNVVFTTTSTPVERLAARVSTAMGEKVGISPKVVVATAAQISKALAENPFGKLASNPSRLLVAFLEDKAQLDALKPLTEREWGSEALALGTHVAFLWCPDGVIASELAKAVGRVLGDTVTVRNWTTVGKIGDILSAGTP